MCAANSDCCPSCERCPPRAAVSTAGSGDAAGKAAAAVERDADSALGRAVAAEAAAARAAAGQPLHDCGAPRPYPVGSSAGPGGVGIAAAPETELQAEQQMQACQVADKGTPSQPEEVELYWTAGRVCRGGTCTGGVYSVAEVQRQMEVVNNIYAHAGIRFLWCVPLGRAVTPAAACALLVAKCWLAVGSPGR